MMDLGDLTPSNENGETKMRTRFYLVDGFNGFVHGFHFSRERAEARLKSLKREFKRNNPGSLFCVGIDETEGEGVLFRDESPKGAPFTYSMVTR